MDNQPLYQLNVSAESLRMSPGIFWFLVVCLILSCSFIVIKMIIPILAIRPFPVGTMIISLVLIFFLGFLGKIFYSQYARSESLNITLYKKGVQFDDSIGLVPYSEINISLGKMEGMNLTEGAATSIPFGDALIFKINNFDRYFDINFFEQLSAQYVDQGTYKVQISEKGLSEKQVDEFLLAYKKIAASE